MGRWVTHELVGPGPRFAWTLLLAVAALALSAYAGRRAGRTSGPEAAGRSRQLRRRRALAQRQRRVAARTARRRRRSGRRLRRRRAVQARLHLEIDLRDGTGPEGDGNGNVAGPGPNGARRSGAVLSWNGAVPSSNGAALSSNGFALSANGADPAGDIAIDISVDLAADLAVGNLPPLPVVYESEITLESGETLDCGIVAPFRTR
ncbi:MAG TPA: hypothetical protein VFS16_07010 [Acidimicrobiia bacterium]|nr:hypothetical protein [Acidimicrobiia bacterium]